MQRDKALETIRQDAHGCWRRTVLLSFIHHQKTTHGSLKHGVSEEADKDLEAGMQCIHYAALSSWWDWDVGSRTFFWRWSLE
eukprot:14594281-Ditylum_brightwellii.AAC.1